MLSRDRVPAVAVKCPLSHAHGSIGIGIIYFIFVIYIYLLIMFLKSGTIVENCFYLLGNKIQRNKNKIISEKIKELILID